ncbi:hypothetical protein GPECTOR_1g574 [Gonium pectorale]|uniref:Uncharacterized protein n=1 Tax=Gonium pectorale TaxID=33097 RepID=A0A150H384_GONPE|nr:hypothetical protein GPECTOR_1g574 [Gonium pectorale]|eukprot:KXZ56637.1 hypothetical protein GPECTOR_1g574 [Gonium pectorale]
MAQTQAGENANATVTVDGAGNVTASSFPPAAAALAALTQLEEAPVPALLAGTLPPAVQATGADGGYNISGGLSEEAREARTSYVMAVPGTMGAAMSVLSAPPPLTAAQVAAKENGRGPPGGVAPVARGAPPVARARAALERHLHLHRALSDARRIMRHGALSPAAAAAANGRNGAGGTTAPSAEADAPWDEPGPRQDSDGHSPLGAVGNGAPLPPPLPARELADAAEPAVHPIDEGDEGADAEGLRTGRERPALRSKPNSRLPSLGASLVALQSAATGLMPRGIRAGEPGVSGSGGSGRAAVHRGEVAFRAPGSGADGGEGVPAARIEEGCSRSVAAPSCPRTPAPPPTAPSRLALELPTPPSQQLQQGRQPPRPRPASLADGRSPAPPSFIPSASTGSSSGTRNGQPTTPLPPPQHPSSKEIRAPFRAATPPARARGSLLGGAARSLLRLLPLPGLVDRAAGHSAHQTLDAAPHVEDPEELGHQVTSSLVSTSLTEGGPGSGPSLSELVRLDLLRLDRIHSTAQAHEALGRLADCAAEQSRLAAALEEWVADHPLAHVALQREVLGLQAELVRVQLALWRPAELLNGRMALIGLTAGLAKEAAGGPGLLAQAAAQPLSMPAAFALVVLLTAFHKQVMQPRMRLRTRGLLMSPVAHRWMGRAAMVGIVWAVVQEATDPAHRPLMQQLRDGMAGLTEGVQGPGTAAAAAAAAQHGAGQPPGLRQWLWNWLLMV